MACGDFDFCVHKRHHFPVTKAIAGFDWDDGNREHCQKHGVSLEEIASALLGPLYRFPDPGHSNAGTRWRAIGRTAAGRHVFVVYTMRNKAGRI
ncbi:BrnT family toxin [Methylobacterium iners]|uniref:DUF4258 domain-containing protein n=1 Tax=Methylobacterium iners TaxID=418707 RepID=A0ABQ4S2H0_9HYPH|nr:BrnT family toxin [Methylobacterium iners]GJD96679.1 hypothetical protein OCOJLMKI_3903 [Methylobacterium iners]